MADMSFKNAYWLTFVLLLIPIILGPSVVLQSDPIERVRAFTRPIEFDYFTWTLDALGIKFSQLALNTADYMHEAEQSKTVLAELEVIRQINQVNAQLNDIYADPAINNPEIASAGLVAQLHELRKRQAQLEPLAESILQDQVSLIAAEAGLTFGGQAIPSVLYHTTPPPDALIISPREVIRQDQDISISPDISIDQMEKLENQVDKALNVSSLVVGIDGIGTYPTMVQETTDINRLAEVVAHEWVHNYLTLRPLGVSYLNSPELRTMNETAASIAGSELGRAVIARFYSEYLPPPPAPAVSGEDQTQPASPPVFNPQAEMHTTRVTTDRLLAEGKVEEAEAYMEQRRQFFWENGYHYRKINQAFFAFYGAYADQPGGPAGADPVGAAVRLLRQDSPSLANFINRISWMWKFEQLQKAVGGG